MIHISLTLIFKLPCNHGTPVPHPVYIIHVYLLSSVEIPEENKRTESSEEERGLLVCSTDSYQSIEASSGVVINSDSLNSNYNFTGLRRSYSPQFASSLNTEGSEVEWSFS